MALDRLSSSAAKDILKIFGDPSISHMHRADAAGLVGALGWKGLIQALGSRKRGQLADRQMHLKEKYAPYEHVINPREDRQSRESIAGSKRSLDEMLFGKGQGWEREKFGKSQAWKQQKSGIDQVLKRDELAERVRHNKAVEDRLQAQLERKNAEKAEIELPEHVEMELWERAHKQFPKPEQTELRWKWVQRRKQAMVAEEAEKATLPTGTTDTPHQVFDWGYKSLTEKPSNIVPTGIGTPGWLYQDPENFYYRSRLTDPMGPWKQERTFDLY